MDPISLALGLATVVPSIVRWVAGDNAGDVAQKVVDTAETITGQKGQDAVSAIKADPALQLQLQQLWSQQELALYQEDSKRLAEVNATMRAEGQSADPWQRRWRPFWGFASAWAFLAAIIGIIALAAVAIVTNRPELL